jgi:hypothetical protein
MHDLEETPRMPLPEWYEDWYGTNDHPVCDPTPRDQEDTTPPSREASSSRYSALALSLFRL